MREHEICFLSSTETGNDHAKSKPKSNNEQTLEKCKEIYGNWKIETKKRTDELEFDGFDIEKVTSGHHLGIAICRIWLWRKQCERKDRESGMKRELKLKMKMGKMWLRQGTKDSHSISFSFLFTLWWRVRPFISICFQTYK